MVHVLFSAGIHGDEINGVEIVRQLITKKINKPKRNHMYSIINMFGFLNKAENFLMARLESRFPGSKMALLPVALPITCLHKYAIG
jgi:hypothetical protein